MSVDPMDLVQQDDDAKSGDAQTDAAKNRLNVWVALTVALLATFLAICSIKGGNIAQGMQEAQKQSIDNWGWYQAKKTRLELYQATLAQLQLASVSTAPAARAGYAEQIRKYEAKIKEQTAPMAGTTVSEMEQKQTDAADQDKLYGELNHRDDQFDLAEAMISLAIALLALTSLTGKRWLFGLAMIPAVFGVVMGVCGLVGIPFHPDALIVPLT